MLNLSLLYYYYYYYFRTSTSGRRLGMKDNGPNGIQEHHPGQVSIVHRLQQSQVINQNLNWSILTGTVSCYGRTYWCYICTLLLSSCCVCGGHQGQLLGRKNGYSSGSFGQISDIWLTFFPSEYLYRGACMHCYNSGIYFSVLSWRQAFEYFLFF